MTDPQIPEAPKLLSEAIYLALADLEKVEADDRYQVDMDIWHASNHNSGKCHVCFAGAVMAKSCKTDIRLNKGIGSFDQDWANVFCALDSARVYQFKTAARQMDLQPQGNDFDPVVDRCSYTTDPAQFKANMRHAADELAKVGL